MALCKVPNTVNYFWLINISHSFSNFIVLDIFLNFPSSTRTTPSTLSAPFQLKFSSIHFYDRNKNKIQNSLMYSRVGFPSLHVVYSRNTIASLSNISHFEMVLACKLINGCVHFLLVTLVINATSAKWH